MTSLHTTYRPTSFDSVVGQGDAVRSLKAVIREGRAHTFLFTGTPGTGKTTLARIVAAEFAGSRQAVGIIEVDAATNSGADAMREVVAKTHYRAVGSSPVKAIICDECQRLSSAAWTILLKPIEEPPKHVFWFFCSTEPSKIPKAILTRCLRFDLKPLSEDHILEVLISVADQEKLTTPDDILEAIAENSGGSPRQALVFLEQCASCSTATDALRIMRTAAQAKEPVDLAKLLIAKRGATWQSAVKIINAMESVDAETVRIVLVNYIAGALARTKSEDEAKNLLRVLDAFHGPYVSSDKLAPLFISIGLALGLDQ